MRVRALILFTSWLCLELATVAQAQPSADTLGAVTVTAVRMAVPTAKAPVRGASSLAFILCQPEDVRVTVHDVLGRMVATAADRAFSAGDQRVELDVSGLAPGPYRVRVTSLSLTRVQ